MMQQRKKPGTGALPYCWWKMIPPLRAVLKSILEIQSFNVLETDSKVGAMAILGDDENTIHVMILDLGLPPKAHTTEEGLDVIVQTTSAMHATKIIVLTGQDEEKSALDAIREGAFDFLSKPAKSEDILTAVNRAILFHSKEQDLSIDGMTRVYHINTICGEETAMAVSDIEFMELDTVHVKGKKIISKIFHPLGLKSEVSEHMKKILEQHNHALNCYYEKNFTEADDVFCRLIQQNTGYEDCYRYMLHQVAEKKNITTVMQGEIS